MNVLDRVLGLIAPYECVGCFKEGGVICDQCLLSLTDTPSLCYRCFKATNYYRPCPDHVSSNKPNRVFAVCEYSDLAKCLVVSYKFEQKRQAVDIITNQLDDILPYYNDIPLVTYVPSAGRHIRERGYDHTKLIATHLAKARSWPYAQLLAKTANLKQVGSNRANRFVQIAGALRVCNVGLIKNKHIILVDDVITTGATIEACTKLLRQNGAKSVDAIVFARTPKLVSSI